jgi:hypothetical protein
MQRWVEPRLKALGRPATKFNDAPGPENKRQPFWEIDELTREEGEMFAFADAIEQSSGRNSRTGTQCGARAAI